MFIVNLEIRPIPPHFFLRHQHPQPIRGDSPFGSTLERIAAENRTDLFPKIPLESFPVTRYGAGGADHFAKGAAEPHITLCFVGPEDPG